MSNNQNSIPTPVVDGLVKTYPSLKVGNKAAVETKLKAISEGGCEKLQLIVDFDNTLTRHHKNGNLTDCSWGVMENSPLLPKGYTDKTNALRAKYLPIEMDPNLTVEEKIPHMEAWYKQANKLLQETGIQKDLFSQFVKTSNVEFRDHTKHMLDHLHQAQIPVLGQAHDMFSRIFRKRVYEFFLPNIMYLLFVLIFSNSFFDQDQLSIYNKPCF